jgi:hypothetical protein
MLFVVRQTGTMTSMSKAGGSVGAAEKKEVPTVTRNTGELLPTASKF